MGRFVPVSWAQFWARECEVGSSNTVPPHPFAGFAGLFLRNSMVSECSRIKRILVNGGARSHGYYTLRRLAGWLRAASTRSGKGRRARARGMRDTIWVVWARARECAEAYFWPIPRWQFYQHYLVLLVGWALQYTGRTGGYSASRRA